MRAPSTSTRLWAALVPRMKMPGKLPRPPVGATCTPGTRLSRSVTLVGCRRSMSVAGEDGVGSTGGGARPRTWRLALISTSGSLRASSRSAASSGRVRGRSNVAKLGAFMGSTMVCEGCAPRSRQQGRCLQVGRVLWAIVLCGLSGAPSPASQLPQVLRKPGERCGQCGSGLVSRWAAERPRGYKPSLAMRAFTEASIPAASSPHSASICAGLACST